MNLNLLKMELREIAQKTEEGLSLKLIDELEKLNDFIEMEIEEMRECLEEKEEK